MVINEHDQVVYQNRLLNNLSLIARPLSSYRASLEGIVVVPTVFWGNQNCQGREIAARLEAAPNALNS